MVQRPDVEDTARDLLVGVLPLYGVDDRRVQVGLALDRDVVAELEIAADLDRDLGRVLVFSPAVGSPRVVRPAHAQAEPVVHVGIYFDGVGLFVVEQAAAVAHIAVYAAEDLVDFALVYEVLVDAVVAPERGLAGFRRRCVRREVVLVEYADLVFGLVVEYVAIECFVVVRRDREARRVDAVEGAVDFGFSPEWPAGLEAVANHG